VRYDTLVAIVMCLVAMLSALLLHAANAATWPDEMPPPKFDQQMWEAAQAALGTPAEPVECMQIRAHGHAAVCITEMEWRRQHANDQ
jgi:hypothetical protein